MQRHTKVLRLKVLKPVAPLSWKELGKIKEAGQTYDELIGKLIQAHNRKKLAAFAKSAKSGKGNWTDLEDI